MKFYIIIGIVEKYTKHALMLHIMEPLLCFMNRESVLESRDTPTSHCVTR